MNPNATFLTRAQVLLDWAYAEALSPRWGGDFPQRAELAVLTRLRVLPPAHLPEPMQQALIDWLVHTRRKLVDAYLPEGGRYTQTSMTAIEIERIFIMPPRFMAAPARTTLAAYIEGMQSGKYKNELLKHAEALRTSGATAHGHPILAQDPQMQAEVLIEGYARCISRILQHRKGTDSAPLTLIRCAPARE